ncbi:MAG: Bug family tripartite tricarboxylate transporter substrate binding protein [bacterium]|jgi:tripartite-type tricarboxylate transporter receptor subunit TctC|nr:tripartite tricarboxylate transporter substrate binding protein [Betaproteobacteria bacterium]
MSIPQARSAAPFALPALVALAALMLPQADAVHAAEAWPARPIRMVLPFPPGGATDTVGRIAAQKIGENLGQPVVTDNRPGAAGAIGFELAAKSRPDGYTLVVAGQPLVVLPVLYRKLPFDMVRDFTPITLLGQTPQVLVGRAALPVRNLKELIDHARAHPRKVSYGSGGVGTGNHLGGEMLQHLAKIDLLHVPYKGAGQAFVAVMAGEVDLVTIGMTTALTQIQSGKVRALAALTPKRSAALPDLATSAESGYPDFRVNSFHALLAPTGTPRTIIDRLNGIWAKAVSTADTRERMEKAEVEPVSTTPEEFRRFQMDEIARWTTLLKGTNLRLD